VLPLYPGFLAYLCGQTNLGAGKRRYMLGFFVLAGVLTMMLVLGGIIAALALPIGRSLAYVTPLADGVIMLLGILLVADRNPFTRLPQVRLPAFRHPLVNAYSYGLLYGPLALPCSSPLVVAIFALSLTVGEALNMFWTFVWFGIGFGVPLLVLSLLSGALQRQLTTLFARHSRQINALGGILLVGVAVFDLAQNWQTLRLFYFR
jgi:cytochrome c-type biogenesis protein